MLLPLISIAFNDHQVKRISFSGQAQGTTYLVTYYSTDTLVHQSQIDSIFRKIDSSLSLYKTYSLISEFNAADSITADEHFLMVVKKSIETYKRTKGIFDITVHPLVEAWGFGTRNTAGLPDSASIREIKQCVGSSLLRIADNKVYKKKSCVKIDLNGIAQGYTVDLLYHFLRSQRIVNFLVEVGGEIRVSGRKPGNEKMKIGIESPGIKSLQRIIELDNGAVTTSGSYRRYYESEGKKITHLIDPRTGFPITNEMISVTVIAKDAITADAYDNAIMVMGLKEGFAFSEKNRLAVHFIYRTNEGLVKDTMTKAFLKLTKN